MIFLIIYLIGVCLVTVIGSYLFGRAGDGLNTNKLSEAVFIVLSWPFVLVMILLATPYLIGRYQHDKQEEKARKEYWATKNDPCDL